MTTDGSGDIETYESSESFEKPCPATLATGKKLDLGCVPMRKDPKDIWRTSFTVPNKTCCLHHISTTTVPFSSWVWSWRAAPSMDVQSAMATMYTRIPPKPGLSIPWDMHESIFWKYVKYTHLNPKPNYKFLQRLACTRSINPAGWD